MMFITKMPQKIEIKKEASSNGFTLIEMLVAMAVFSVLIVSITGIFISTLKAQRLALAQNSIQESGRYILEFITKEIRMSQQVSETGESAVLNVVNSDGKNVTYFFSGAFLARREGILTAQNLNSSANEEITGSFFVQKNAYSSASLVTIILQIKNTSPQLSEKPFINLQTTVATRN